MHSIAHQPPEVFVDLTSTPDRSPTRTGAWPQAGRFPSLARTVTCVVPAGTWSRNSEPLFPEHWRIIRASSAINPCSETMARAAAGHASLLILTDCAEVPDEALFVMREALERDPLFGSVVPRVGCARGCCFRLLSKHGLGDGEWIPRRTLAELRDLDVCPELFSPGLLLAPEVVAEFGSLDTRFISLAAALVHYLARARRRGYRTVVANRAVIRISGLGCDVPQAATIPETDRVLLANLVPDLERGWREFRAGSNERFEKLAGDALRASAGQSRPSLLLDVRNVVALQNGTTRAALGCLRALRRLAPAWDVEVVANPTAARFHRLEELCGGWPLHTAMPDGGYTAALRLSQPWHIQEMVDLHRAALVNVYFMLDTISWDVVYAAPPHHDGTWSFLADHADGFLFDSAFTEQRFISRFERARGTPSAVCYYPFDPADYVLAEARRTPESDYILILGNELDHKDVLQTVELVSRGFPFQSLVALGPHLEESGRLRVYRTGHLLEADIHRLYAGARLIIFPSFYEGFGFPVVTALAYGKTLIARRSDLLSETAARCRAGRVIAFTHREELVEILGRLLHGEPVQEIPVGTAVAGSMRNWQDVAQDIMTFLETLIRQPGGTRWLERERAVNQLLAFRS
jgi:glycosyltransferase involved in cell wall biosynthesis